MRKPPELAAKMKACQGHQRIFRHDLGGWWCEHCHVMVADDSPEVELEALESRVDACPHHKATRKGSWGLAYYCDKCGVAVAKIKPELLEEEVLASGDRHRIEAWRAWQDMQQSALEFAEV